ncbi:hypothetical protein PRZ48_012956 [Zasmidium cellare]|uniref:polynucleotide adenylyltransferase n=1 Tax=Zasmidium cellare TaxID=395010 RepID=A0ABR0E3K7_ZASCE|nr:hypothetical protein PRZ48_012956 [Zasmidium cellare]
MGDSYRPPPPRDRGGGGYYDNGYYDHGYHNQGYQDQGYSFRGAADTYRPQPPPPRREERFSFNPPSDRSTFNPPSDRFAFNPPSDRFTFNPPSGPSAPRFPAQQPPPREQPSNRSANKTRGGRERKPPRKVVGALRRAPRPAHSRALLSRRDRETTPEQLAGMNVDDQPRYVDKASDSEDEDHDEDDSSDSDDSSDEASDDGQPRKRAKTDDQSDQPAPARPQWSNPDPYSVLPPTDLGLQPKKDIVQTIRKAKVEVSSRNDASNAVKENVDFISFDTGDDAEQDEAVDDEDGESWMPTDEEVKAMVAEKAAAKVAAQKERGKKRKRGEEQSIRFGDVVQEWVADPSDPMSTPWYRPDKGFTSSMGLQLHKEIVDFCDYVRPHRYEENVRNDLIDRIERAVRRWGPASVLDVKVLPFGSFASGLYLPTADMDLVAVSKSYRSHGPPRCCQTKNGMYGLSRYLQHEGIPRQGTLQVVAKAKVPIIKFVDDRTGIKVDISFENDTGLNAIDTFMRWKKQFPEMPFLVSIIKQYLSMRNLNEVFSGGLGGFTIICLVVSMLQRNAKLGRQPEDPGAQYGELLRDFFQLYGHEFDIQNTGINMEPAEYFDKKDPYAYSAVINRERLTIIDPNNPKNDISGGSRRVGEVFASFRKALAAIQGQMNNIRLGKAESSSILGCLLAGDYTSFEEQRAVLDRIDRADRPAAESRPAPGSDPGLTFRPPPPAPAQSGWPPQPQQMLTSAPQTQHGWATYSQQDPPPARSGHYYASSSAYDSQHPGLSYPPQQAPQQAPPSLAADPRPSYGMGNNGVPNYRELNRIQKENKKKKRENNPNPTHDDLTKKTKAQKKRERKEKKKLENLQQATGNPQGPQATKKKSKKSKKNKASTEAEKTAIAKQERDARARKRHGTL